MAQCHVVVEIKMKTGLEKEHIPLVYTLKLSTGVILFGNPFLILKVIKIPYSMDYRHLTKLLYQDIFIMIGLYGCPQNKAVNSLRVRTVCNTYITYLDVKLYQLSCLVKSVPT